MFSKFEWLIAVLGWLRIAASPLLAGVIAGALVYLPNPTPPRMSIALLFVAAGAASGIIWANRVWKTKGTINFLSGVSTTLKDEAQGHLEAEEPDKNETPGTRTK